MQAFTFCFFLEKNIVLFSLLDIFVGFMKRFIVIIVHAKNIQGKVAVNKTVRKVWFAAKHYVNFFVHTFLKTTEVRTLKVMEKPSAYSTK